MSAIPKPRYTPTEYLVRERASEFRHEYLRGEIFQMAGTSYPHTVITRNLIHRLANALEKTPCQPLMTDMRVLVSRTGLYTYPDVLILCDPPELEDHHGDTLLNPTVIIEVLSPSTEKYDRGAKFGHYRQIPSFQEYVLVAQDRISVERFVRQPKGTWEMTPYEKLDDELQFDRVPALLKLTEIYDGVTFPDPATGEKP